MAVSVERQLELAEKYGVSGDIIEAIQSEEINEEERGEKVGQVVVVFVNAILRMLIDLDDIEDVSTIVGSRYGVSKEDYKKALNWSGNPQEILDWVA